MDNKFDARVDLDIVVEHYQISILLCSDGPSGGESGGPPGMRVRII